MSKFGKIDLNINKYDNPVNKVEPTHSVDNQDTPKVNSKLLAQRLVEYGKKEKVLRKPINTTIKGENKELLEALEFETRMKTSELLDFIIEYFAKNYIK